MDSSILSQADQNTGDMAAGTAPPMFDYSQFLSPAPAKDPYIGLRVKIQDARKAALDRQRAVDTATTPLIQQDIIASAQHQQDISSKIDQALAVLQQPPPSLQQGPSDNEIMAAAIGGIVAPGNVPHVLNALAQVSGARNAVEFDNKLRQYGLTRETASMALQHLQRQLESEVGNERRLKDSQMDWRVKMAQTEQEINDQYDRMDLMAQQEGIKYGIDQDQYRQKLAMERQVALDKARKDTLAQWNTNVDNFRNWVASAYPPTVTRTPAMAAAINAEADRQAAATGTPRNLFGSYADFIAPATQNADLNAKRFEQVTLPALELRQQMLDISRERLNLARAKAETAVSPEIKDKRKKIAALDTKITNAKVDVDALQSQPRPANPDEAAKYDAKLQDALATEWALVNLKRKAVTGKGVDFQAYLDERLPQSAGFWSTGVPPNMFGPINPKGLGLRPDPTLDVSTGIRRPNPKKTKVKLPPGVKVVG